MIRWVVLLLAVTSCHRVFGVSPDDLGDRLCCVPDQECGNQVNAIACGALKCIWSDTAVCTGAHAACVTYGAEPACVAHLGCGWSAGVCAGTHRPCDQLTSAEECGAHNCMIEDTCGGKPNPCDSYSGNAVRCVRHACTYDADTNICSGTHRGCEKYRDDSSDCADAGCDRVFEKCGGKEHDCGADAEGACATSGCTWTPGECSGAPQEACGNFDEPVCGVHEGCGWSPTGGCNAPATCAERSPKGCRGDGCVLELCAP